MDSYIFPIAEIECHIFEFLDTITDLCKIMLLNKYYYSWISQMPIFVELKQLHQSECKLSPIEAAEYNFNLISKYLCDKHMDPTNIQTYSACFTLLCSTTNILIIEWFIIKYSLQICVIMEI